MARAARQDERLFHITNQSPAGAQSDRAGTRMSKPLTTSLPTPGDVELTHLVKLLHETEARLRELLGGKVDAVIGPGGQTFLLREAQDLLHTA